MNESARTFPYRRVAVIGCPGSGKSTLSRRLRDATGLPLYHLDAIFWRPDRTSVPKEEFREIQREILAGDTWIIDGNYQSTIEWRISACDLLILLDYPTELCLEGVRARRGQKRSDLPWVEGEEDGEFLDFIRSFQTESRPRILELIRKYPEKAVLIFQTRDEADGFLASLRPETSFGS